MKKHFWITACLFLIAYISVSPLHVLAGTGTIYDSPYVSFSAGGIDGVGWTTNAGDRTSALYENGTRVYTGIQSTLRLLKTGEHYYLADRVGHVPVGYWEVEWSHAQCIHYDIPGYKSDKWDIGVDYNTYRCFQYHYSGWMAYCADCGELISPMFIYMSKEAAQSISYLELETGLWYYYLCPHCNTLEQGANFAAHKCKQISWNMYQVVYDANAEQVGGYMDASYHMYNNEKTYEGETVEASTRLTKNAYSRIGYVFTGWNTKPDGTGKNYSDEQEILNLTTKDLNVDKDAACIKLYAQWRKCESTLVIDPNGGTYKGSAARTEIKQSYSSFYNISKKDVVAPIGYLISFVENGGTGINDFRSTKHFNDWTLIQPFDGTFGLKAGLTAYTFTSTKDGNIDTIQATYEPDPITLPEITRANYSFGGWFYDAAFTKPAGMPGDKITPIQDTTLYAQWVSLTLTSTDNYTANNGKGAVDLSWSQQDGRAKTYMLYQSRDGINWTRINAQADFGIHDSINATYGYSGTASTYVVPYTGIYVISGYGAQGGNYGAYQGGPGGYASGKFYLRKGDVLTIFPGAQKRVGYFYGGAGQVYGCGGGASAVYSQQQGWLIAAGGGGGATSVAGGYPGGQATSLRADRISTGADGYAGGGGGYMGGNAGEYIQHFHSANCYTTASGANAASAYMYSSANQSGQFWWSGLHTNSVGYTGNSAWVSGHTGGDNPSPSHGLIVGNGSNYLATPYSGNLSFNVIVDEIQGGWRRPTTLNVRVYANTGALLLNQDFGGGGGMGYYTPYSNPRLPLVSKRIGVNEGNWVCRAGAVEERNRTYFDYAQSGSGWSMSQTEWYVDPNTNCPHGDGAPSQYYSSMLINMSIPENVSGIYVYVNEVSTTDNAWMGLSVSNLYYSYSFTALTCGYTDGQVISSKPAYGGSSFVNPSALTYQLVPGTRYGNGDISLSAVKVGFNESEELKSVTATDYAAPDAVNEDTVLRYPDGDNALKITWMQPKDNG
ncbi:MAG: InlB B-repeat-containing protein, partial [Acetatifactor sp.]|nr:InlB B-repeat-containing protein [Acetatifactor sp.]